MHRKKTKLKTPKKQKRIGKGWAVLFSRRPFTPAEWLGAYTIFETKSEAFYWARTRVHISIPRKVVPVSISYRVKDIIKFR